MQLGLAMNTQIEVMKDAYQVLAIEYFSLIWETAAAPAGLRNAAYAAKWYLEYMDRIDKGPDVGNCMHAEYALQRLREQEREELHISMRSDI